MLKSSFRLAVIMLVVLLGLYMGWRLSGVSKPEEVAPEEEQAATDRFLPLQSSVQWLKQPEKLHSKYPSGAVKGELVFTFKSKQAYLDYLAMLVGAGLKPLGQIDALNVLRLEEAVLSLVKTPFEDLEIGFNFVISVPAPPNESFPVAAMNLAPYNETAGRITGALEGDGSGVRVAVLDSGLFEHDTFEGVEIEELVLVGERLDDPGAEHGTGVASIIGGKEGVAPGCSLLVVRVLGEDGQGNSFEVAKGIVHAVESGAQIINLSLGSYQDSALLRHAVQYAHGKGVLMVASGGNDGYTALSFPAAYPEVLSVTAVDMHHRHAGFPNQSEEIDFAAPGVGILSAGGEGGDSQLFTGTSAAAPFVTGTLAALISRDPLRPASQSVEELKESLNDSGALGPDPLYGGGWIDWERLSDRGEDSRPDIALADIHFPLDALPGTTVPIEIVIQNRGNQWLSGGNLTVELNDGSRPQTFALRSTRPGEAFVQRIFAQIPSVHSGEQLRVFAMVEAEESIVDTSPENNLKAINIQPIQ